jgi:hypothetical protein
VLTLFCSSPFDDPVCCIVCPSYLSDASPAARDALVTEALALAKKSLLAVESFSDFEIALKRSLRAFLWRVSGGLHFSPVFRMVCLCAPHRTRRAQGCIEDVRPSESAHSPPLSLPLYGCAYVFLKGVRFALCQNSNTHTHTAARVVLSHVHSDLGSLFQPSEYKSVRRWDVTGICALNETNADKIRR